ncbi:MAG: glycosyltransferase family 2 protein [Nitrososphaerota archaeon]|nr:glycosyltransferase family 2 protein [Nitrososphaerota archaeon]
MTEFNKKSFSCSVVVYLTVVLLSLLYLSRVHLFGWHWAYWVLVIYGVVVTPYLIFRLVVTYLYTSTPYQNYHPSVSVVVPVYNEEEGISSTIDSIFNSDYPRDKLELIVIDDKSTDDTLEVINKKRLEYDFKVVTLDENGGKRHAMAAGFKQCTGEILVCIDSDTVIKSDAITMVVQPFTDNVVYCVCGNAVAANSSESDNTLARLQKAWYADSFRLRKGVESLFGMVICCSGVLAAYRRDKVEKIVDEWVNEKFLGRHFESGDDRQLTNRMLRMGGKSVFQSTALAYTVVPHVTKTFLIQQIRWGRSGFRGMLFASKFFYKKNPIQFTLFYLTMFMTFFSPISFLVNTIGLVLLGQYDSMIVYFFGIFLISALTALSTKLLVNYFTLKDIVYRLAFSLVAIVLSFVYLYAWITLWKGNVWGTR